MKETVTLNKETYDKMVEEIRGLKSAYAITYHVGWGRKYLTKEDCKELEDAVYWEEKVAQLKDRIEVLEAEKAQLEATRPARGIKLFGLRITREK